MWGVCTDSQREHSNNVIKLLDRVEQATSVLFFNVLLLPVRFAKVSLYNTNLYLHSMTGILKLITNKLYLKEHYMQMKKFLIVGVLILFSFFTYSQKIIISGQEGLRKLTWNDFTGQVDESSLFVAFTWYNYKFKYSSAQFIGDSVVLKDFQVILQLDPKKSWAKQDKVTDDLLIHEQGHFNIGILFMNELLLKINSAKFFRNSWTTDFPKVIKEVSQKYAEMGVTYDEETNHAKNKRQQAKWNEMFQSTIKF